MVLYLRMISQIESQVHFYINMKFIFGEFYDSEDMHSCLFVL